MIFKYLVVYYLFIVLPIGVLILAVKYNYVSNKNFGWMLLVYCLLYHPAVSGLRLVVCEKIKASQFWLNFIPLWNARYFEFLFFNK